MDASRPMVDAATSAVGSIATQIWLWGQGARPQLPGFSQPTACPSTDFGRRSGARPRRARGIEVLDVPGATAGFDNDYVAQRDAAIAFQLADRDFFLLHVEATDEAGHQRAADEKVASLESMGFRHHRPAPRCSSTLGPTRSCYARITPPPSCSDPHLVAGPVSALRFGSARPRW